MSALKPLTGLFLGAGASYEAGMPLVWELTAEIKSWLTAEKLRELNAGWRTQAGGHTDAVVDDLISVLERPTLHYEAILGYLETQFRRQRVAPQEYHGLYSWFVELVYHILYLRHVNNRAFISHHLKRYDGIRALADANAPLWIFSLNHDMIIEAIAARLSISIHSGFSKSTVSLPRRGHTGAKKGEIHAEVLTKHGLDHSAMFFPNPRQPGICLLKIHGALDVFTFNDGQDLLKLIPVAPGAEGILETLRVANEELRYPLPGFPGGCAKATNEITYADEQGVMQFLRRSLLAGAFKFDVRGTQVLPMSMLRHFRENLNFLTKLVCVGYGFGDLHINLVIRGWLELSAERQLEIVGPGAEAVPPFLLHLSPQVTLTKSSATEYFDSQAGIVRSPRENLETRVGAILRRLGKERAAETMNAFFQCDRERSINAFAAKLAALPRIDGPPDASAIGDPSALTRQWAIDLKLTPDDQLERLLRHLEAVEG